MISETIRAMGHKNVTAKHGTTLEITKEREMTVRGDCIVAVSADKGMSELTEEFKGALRCERARLEITLRCGGVSMVLNARGHPGLILTHPTDMVVRKSDFICPRTLAIRADKAAFDLDREFVDNLKKKGHVSVTLRIFTSKSR